MGLTFDEPSAPNYFLLKLEMRPTQCKRWNTARVLGVWVCTDVCSFFSMSLCGKTPSICAFC